MPCRRISFAYVGPGYVISLRSPVGIFIFSERYCITQHNVSSQSFQNGPCLGAFSTPMRLAFASRSPEISPCAYVLFIFSFFVTRACARPKYRLISQLLHVSRRLFHTLNNYGPLYCV